MIYIHGSWIPSLSIIQPGFMFVWGETLEASSKVVERVKKGESFPLHPFVSHAYALRSALFPLKGTDVYDTGQMQLRRKMLEVELPSIQGVPIASSVEFRHRLGQTNSLEEATLTRFRVEGFLIPGTIFMETMMQIQASADSSSIILSPSFQYWLRAARLALRMTRQGLWYPTLIRNEKDEEAMHEYTGRWHLFTGESETQSAMQKLAAEMPPVCRSFTATTSHTSEQLIEDCLQVSVDQYIKKELEQTPTPLLPKMTGLSKSVTLEGRWFHSLVVSRPEMIDSHPYPGIVTLAEEMKHWLYPLGFRSKEEIYQTAFRFEPPHPASEHSGNGWTLEAGLLAMKVRDDFITPSLFSEKGVSNWAENRFVQDLQRVVQMDPLLGSFQIDPNQRLKLSASEAYDFLTRVADKLGRMGFVVLLPGWWNARTPSSSLQMQFHISSFMPKAADEGLGLATLVQTDWKILLGDESLTEEEWKQLLQSQSPLVYLRERWVVFEPELAERMKRRLSAHRRQPVVPLGKALHLPLVDWQEATTPATTVTWESEGWIDSFLKTFSGERFVSNLSDPAGLEGTLRPYQHLGYEWLFTMRKWGLGALLADDMGLGKSIQWIAYMLHCKERNQASTVSLLICPTSVVGNWRRELEKFAPSLRVHVHHGPERLIGDPLAQAKHDFDVIITTYGLVQKDVEWLSAIDWDVVTLDEAQAIKNVGTKQSLAVRMLQGQHRIALTGTPMENRLSELWSIMDFLNPGYLGTASSFRMRYALPIEKSTTGEVARVFSHLIRPFVLRRVKSDPEVIRDLPEKQEMKVYCSLTKEQAVLYQTVVQNMMLKIQRSQGMERRGHILATLTRLKQVCNHPAHYYRDGSETGRRSGKLNVMLERLENVLAKGERALIFTQYTAMGDRLKRTLEQTFSCDILYLHGGTPKAKRDEMVERFQENEDGPPIFVLSLKAGGVGLNLTNANHVFHYDRWWNPAVEDQATDRAFRIGQKRNVFVHKLVSLGTLEERIDEMLEQKRSLAENIIGSGEAWITELSTDALYDIFALRQQSLADED
jgi:SNF2 family DNA or RNA helicase